MKKVAILVLLTALIASLSFAQVSLKTNLEISNINNADVPYGQAGVLPNLTFQFDGAKNVDVGPGVLTLAGELSYVAYFTENYKTLDTTQNPPVLVAASANTLNGDNFIKLGYAVPVGPGKINVGIQETTADSVYGWYLQPWLGYTDIAAGPVNLGVTLLYLYSFDGMDSGTKSGAYLRSAGWTNDADILTFQLDASFSFGLGLTYKFKYAVGPASAAVADTTKAGKTDTGVYQIAYLDLWYKFGALTAGVELDDTGPKFRGTEDAKTGFTVKPYANVGISDSLDAGFYLKAKQLLNDAKADILFSPGVWIKYTL